MLLKRKVDIETAKADTEGVNSLHKTAQNKSADRYITKFGNHIKIDNTNLHPDEVADMVIEQFQLVANEKEEKEYRFGV